MANTTMLLHHQTRAFTFPCTITYNQQFYTKSSSLQTITLLRSTKIQSTLIQKPLILKNDPTTKTPNNMFPTTSKQENNSNPLGDVLDAIANALKALRKPATATVLVFALMIVIISDTRKIAMAASGGRMGGSSFSSRRSSSSSSSSSGSSSGSCYYSSSSSYSSGSSSSSSSSKEMSDEEFKEVMNAIIGVVLFIIFCGFVKALLVTAAERNSIVKLQAGLIGTKKSLQNELNNIAVTANTLTTRGITYVLRETIMALLRKPEYFISAYSSVDIKNSLAGGDKLFNQLSLEERIKLDEETLVNVDNQKKQSKLSSKPTSADNDLIVITILVAAEGKLKLPTITRSKDLKEALQKLGSLPETAIIAAEVIWTPQEEKDSLSDEELLLKYPLLKPLDDSLFNQFIY